MPLISIPELEGNVHDLDGLARLAKHLFAPERLEEVAARVPPRSAPAGTYTGAP